MSDIIIENLSRRHFLQGSAGLTLGFCLPVMAAGATGKSGVVIGNTANAASAATFEPNAFLRIGADNSVTVISKHLEMGQGTYTGLATILADELDADWKRVRVEGAAADAKRYNNTFWDRRRAPAAARRWPIPGIRCARPAPPGGPCWLQPQPNAGMSAWPTLWSATASSAIPVALAKPALANWRSMPPAKPCQPRSN
jgi:hypothetical protein